MECLNICHGNRNRIETGLQHCICRGWKICHPSHKWLLTLSKLESVDRAAPNLDMEAIFHFWFNLTPVNINHGTRGEVLSRGLKL